MHTCLYCGKPIEIGDWHSSCSRKFFGVSTPPVCSLDDEALNEIAMKAVGEGKTIPGVQKKLSLGLKKEPGKALRLTLVDLPTGYILKPQSADYPELPELEDLGMRLADSADIQTVPHAMFRLEHGEIAYITKRIDRKGNLKIAMEDFCQLSGRLTEDKYKGSYEQCAKIIKKWSSQPMLDITNFFYLLLFSFVIGNSDMHLKNFSLIATEAHEYTLCAAYDLLPVKLILTQDTEDLALSLDGKKANIKKSTLLRFGMNIGLSERVISNLMAKLVKLKPKFEEVIDKSFVSNEMKTSLKVLVESRLLMLSETPTN